MGNVTGFAGHVATNLRSGDLIFNAGRRWQLGLQPKMLAAVHALFGEFRVAGMPWTGSGSAPGQVQRPRGW